MLSGTIKKFISNFENEFGNILIETEKFPFKYKESKYTKYFEIFEAKKNFSDWDLKCIIKPENVSAENIKNIESFIKLFDDLVDLDIFISFSEKHRGLWQHIDSKDGIGLTWLQFMAYMPKEKFAPFFDIHIGGLNKELLTELYKDTSDRGFIRQSMITCWRKFKNGNLFDFCKIFSQYVVSSFPNSKTEFKENTIKFFEKECKGLDQTIAFLKEK